MHHGVAPFAPLMLYIATQDYFMAASSGISAFGAAASALWASMFGFGAQFQSTTPRSTLAASRALKHSSEQHGQGRVQESVTRLFEPL